jgi:hypothetical protein
MRLYFTFCVSEQPLLVASQQTVEFLLLPSIHLHVTQGEDLIVGQGFHRQFGHDAIKPLHQHVLKATMHTSSYLPSAPRHLLGELKSI